MNEELKKKLLGMVRSLKKYGFECQGGPLEKCIPFIEIERIVEGVANMNRFVIVEGMDNTGKTTLIQTIIREYARGYSSAKVSLGPNCSRDEQISWLQIVLSQVDTCSNDLLIFDRFLPICDTVYGNILRGGSIWSLEDPELDRIKNLYNPLIIYCRPRLDRIIGFEDGREQMEGVEENAKKLVEAYDFAMVVLADKGFDIVKYDYESVLDKKLIENKIKSLLNANGIL